jgi:hypothetical protein
VLPAWLRTDLAPVSAPMRLELLNLVVGLTFLLVWALVGRIMLHKAP